MDWNDFFSSSPVSNSDTGREQITYIPIDRILEDEQNFYSLSEIPALAGNIATVGLQQPIRVRKHPTEDGKFMIVSGHRRRAALALLAEEDPERWAEVACIIQTETVSPALQQLQLIYANSATRKLSSADMSEQAVQVEKLLYQLQEEGHEFPGRMREHVAKVMQTTNTKLATLKRIREHLADCWQPAYAGGDLSESTAYELSKLPEEDQMLLFKGYGEHPKYLYASAVETRGKWFQAVRGHTCVDKQPCMNIPRKFKACLTGNVYGSGPCQGCCSDCSLLLSCAHACPQTAETVRARKAELLEAAKQRKAEQAERDRPAIDLLTKLWQRFGDARVAAGMSIADSYIAAGQSLANVGEQRHREMEDGVHDFTPYTHVPYGESYQLGYVKTLILFADLFGCSVDYLLGRADSRVSAGSSGNPETMPCAWFPVSVEPPVGVELILIDSGGYVDTGKYKGCGEFTMDFGDPVVLWSYFPDEDAVQEYPPVIWHAGDPDTPGTYAAYVRIEELEKPMLRELRWDGKCWIMFDNKISDLAQVLCWAERPEV